SEWWTSNNEVHEAKVKGPFPNGDRFAVIFDYEITPKAGPYAGKRTRMEEVGVYTVEDGKIVREEFYYPTGA
ncbi:MAG TPA: nuclear transport factor 2 family protein, partial [Vicinamibacteria bacterium]|nr:nuclear transport factor 2 family protein [Vicinamibacteria bacterium]